MISPNNYNIKFRLVEETDAEFIVRIRTDINKARYISPTDKDLDKQKKWIKEYKKREATKEELYFIAIDENNVEFATYRLYNRTKKSIEIGSFISVPLYHNPINVIKVDIIMKAYIYDILYFENLIFEVRKANISVVNYHKKFGPTLINEDELNYYFSLDKKSFYSNKHQFEKLFRIIN
jgi:hypothetical protein